MNPTVSTQDLETFYAGPYWEQTNSNRSPKYRFEKQFRRAVYFDAQLRKAGVPGGGRVLEIGSGFGGVVWALAKLRNMDPYAMELDPNARVFQESLGVRILDATSDANPMTSERFDLVVLSHVLEHQLEPWALLRTAFELVEPSGIVVIEVPHNHFVVDGSILHPLAFSTYSLDYLLGNLADSVVYRTHPGAENVVLPPKYLFAMARGHSGLLQKSVRRPVPLWASLITQRVATFARNFGPLRGLNSRLSRVFRKRLDEKVSRLLSDLPASLGLESQTS